MCVTESLQEEKFKQLECVVLENIVSCREALELLQENVVNVRLKQQFRQDLQAMQDLNFNKNSIKKKKFT